MDTTGLKRFAQSARSLLMEQVRSKLDLVLDPASAARREHPKAMGELDAAISRESKVQVIEQVAYTWFNRFTALRFMDVNSYTSTGIVSPAEGQTRPEILSEAMAGNLPDGAPANITSLLDGRTPSSDPQAEAYRLLLVHACNQWHDQMPFLFEKLDDYTELLMPEDLLSRASILAEVRKVMTQDVCQDVEVIGWLYQFYISEKKDEVFAGLKKNQKITAENIPAATQLFTPHWIVRYLVENSLGRLWLLNRPNSQLAAQMDYYIAPDETETDFLRISRPEDIHICDPACGSGHMLTYAFDLLYRIYEEEGYEATEIPGLILTHNLYGIEIDDRAGALAAFALAMKAATKLGRRRFLRQAVRTNICVLQDVRFSPSEMQAVATVVGSDLFTADFRETMGQFEEAKNFGSLIVPKLRDPAEVARVVRLKDFGGDLLLREVRERVLKVLEMAEALSTKYHVVVANPPYMGSRGMNGHLGDWTKQFYPESKSDLMTCFMQRAVALSQKNGVWAMLNIPSWMFLTSYEDLRKFLICEQKLDSIIHLGRGVFGSDFGTVAFVVSNSRPRETTSGHYRRLFDRHVQVRTPEEIRRRFLDSDKGLFKLAQRELQKVPGWPIAYWISQDVRDIFAEDATIEDLAPVRQGFQTGDNDKFLRFWFEPNSDSLGLNLDNTEDFHAKGYGYAPYNKGGEYRRWFGNNEYVVKFNKIAYAKLLKVGNNLPSRHLYFRESLTWTSISSGSFGARYNGTGYTFSANGACAFPVDHASALVVLALLNSKVTTKLLEFLTPTLDFSVGKIRQIPVARDELSNHRDTILAQCKTMTGTGKSDWDAYENSWDFTTLPLLALEHRDQTLAGSYAKLRDHWRNMTDEMQLLEEKNNRIFIDAYGLQDELTHEVSRAEITLTCNPAYSVGGNKTDEQLEAELLARTIAEFLHYAVGCMFGRYSLDAPGLILANQGEGLADYLARVPTPTFEPDADNVIPVLDGDWFADDITERFRQFLRVTFGEMHFRENLKFIEDSIGKDIRRYFTKDFYADHVRRYKKRPIYWMFSSPKGTFNALIYMHRYKPDTVSVMLNEYLREFISKLEAERRRLEKLSDDPSASQAQRTKALKDIAVVAKQIDELTEWERDIVFPLAQAKIEIDLDDGVKANYPKFGAALKKIPGLDDKDD